MLTQGQMYVLNSGNQIDLDCEFFLDQFTMFDNPIVWKKSQLEEVTQVNTMRNIHNPFILTNRIEVRLTKDAPRYRLQLIIKNCTAEDSGNYTCEVRGKKSAVLTSVSHSIAVRAPIKQVFLTTDNFTSDPSVLPPNGRLRQMTFIDGQGQTLRCVSLGGYPPPSMHLYVGEADVTHEFTESSFVRLDGVPGLRLMNYRTERYSEKLIMSTGDNGEHIKCVATVPGLGSNITTVKIFVNYAPMISCHPAAASVGEREVMIRCEIRSRPDLSALFWIIDVNGTTVTEERGLQDFWSLVRVLSDGLIETQLCLKQVLPHHFRKYTVVAENSIDTTTDHVELLRNHPSSQHKNKPIISTDAPEVSRRIVQAQYPRRNPPYIFITSSVTSSLTASNFWIIATFAYVAFTSRDSASSFFSDGSSLKHEVHRL